MPSLPRPPKAFEHFSATFPKIAEAWKLLGEAGETGPLDLPTQRLVKLAVAVGAGHVGTVHSAVRKARAAGVSDEAMLQVVALAASTIGLPSAVAAQQWIEEVGSKD